MDNLKKNPIAMAILNFIGIGAGASLALFIWSLIDKEESFADKISDPIMIAVIAICAVGSAVSGYLKAKKDQNQKEEKK